MLTIIWRPWEDNRTKAKIKAIKQEKGWLKAAVSEEGQRLVLNCYGYFCKLILKKYHAIIVYFLGILQARACNFTKNEYFLQVILKNIAKLLLNSYKHLLYVKYFHRLLQLIKTLAKT